MTRFLNPLARRSAPGYPEAAEGIKATIRSRLGLSDDVVVSVTEVTCRDGTCPVCETVIALRAPGRNTASVRLPARVPDIGAADISAALAELAWGDRDPA